MFFFFKLDFIIGRMKRHKLGSCRLIYSELTCSEDKTTPSGIWISFVSYIPDAKRTDETGRRTNEQQFIICS